MKKQIAAALAAMFVMSSAAAVMAAPVADDSLKINGEMRVRNTVNEGVSSTDYRIRLTFTKDINENMTLKARFAQNKDIEAASGTAAADIVSLTYKMNDKSKVLVGKDDAWLGNGLLMDTQVEGIQFATGLGDVKVNGIGGRNNQKDLAGISAQTTFGAANLGATYLNNDNTAKNWAVNAGYKFGNAKLAGEYTQNTEATTDDTAYWTTVTFGTVKNVGDASLAVGYLNAEANSGVSAYSTLYTPQQTAGVHNTTGDFVDWKGLTAKGQYMAAKGLTFTVEESLGEVISSGADYNRTRVYMTAKF
jgi:hypothetical protein